MCYRNKLLLLECNQYRKLVAWWPDMWAICYKDILSLAKPGCIVFALALTAHKNVSF